MLAALHSGRHGGRPLRPEESPYSRSGRPLCLPSTLMMDRAGLLRYDQKHVF